jgi:hypothetical protein
MDRHFGVTARPRGTAGQCSAARSTAAYVALDIDRYRAHYNGGWKDSAPQVTALRSGRAVGLQGLPENMPWPMGPPGMQYLYPGTNLTAYLVPRYPVK